MAALDASFSSFNKMTKHLAKSVERGHVDTSQASTTLLAIKDEVQASVRDWAQGVSERTTKMVEELLEHQQEHLSMVSIITLIELTDRLAPYLIPLPIWWTL